MNVLMMALFAGVVGMGAGGIITALFGSKTDKMISIFLSFAGGVMVSIVFLELLPEAIEYANMLTAVLGLVIGALLVLLLNNIVDQISDKNKKKAELHENYAEFFHASELIQKRKSMVRSGMIMLFAIALHNIPEGLALGAAGQSDEALGLTLAILIGLHNIPEGMAISAPLISGGVSKFKTIMLAVLAGSTTMIGAGLGILIGGVSDYAKALSFAIAGGAMLYVVLGEMLPQSIVTNKDRVPTIFALVGIIVGTLLTAIH